jgi:hypothetical protein
MSAGRGKNIEVSTFLHSWIELHMEETEGETWQFSLYYAWISSYSSFLSPKLHHKIIKLQREYSAACSPVHESILQPSPLSRQPDYPTQRVCRVLSFFSCRRNWDSPNPSLAGECAPPPRFWGEGYTCWREGEGYSNTTHAVCYPTRLSSSLLSRQPVSCPKDFSLACSPTHLLAPIHLSYNVFSRPPGKPTTCFPVYHSILQSVFPSTKLFRSL